MGASPLILSVPLDAPAIAHPICPGILAHAFCPRLFPSGASNNEMWALIADTEKAPVLPSRRRRDKADEGPTI